MPHKGKRPYKSRPGHKKKGKNKEMDTLSEKTIDIQNICIVEGCQKLSQVDASNYRLGFYWTPSFFELCAKHRRKKK